MIKFGRMYGVDNNGYFIAKPLYPFFAVLCAVPLIFDMAILAGNERELRQRERTAFWIYCAVPAFAYILSNWIDKHIIIGSIVLAGLEKYGIPFLPAAYPRR